MTTVDRWTGREAKLLRDALRLSVRDFAARLGVGVRTVNKWEARQADITPLPHMQEVLDTALARASDEAKSRFAATTRADVPEHETAQALERPLRGGMLPVVINGRLVFVPFDADTVASRGLSTLLDELATIGVVGDLAIIPDERVNGALIARYDAVWQGTSLRDGDEHDALELARRVAASDVSTETLDRLEGMVDELAVAYPVTPPQELLGPVRRHVSYVMRLLDARKTLDEHRRLLIVGGWLALIAATLYIDLEQRAAANSWLATAASLAQQTGQAEIHAWRYETEAWQVLTYGDYHRAAELSQAAQQLAPRGSPAAIQATAQEGRAWARLGKAKETYDALNRVERFVSHMAKPETPEHHYRYDPDKAEAYVATTLAWLGDVAAERHACHVVATFTHEAEAGRWPRRLASANIDLALALLLTDRLDEARAVAQASMLSGRLVASNHWRALEVVRTIEARGLPEASELREAYELMRQEV